MSQASSIKLENKNDVKIKQEFNLNLAKRDKQKGSSTSEAGNSRKLYACSRSHAVLINTQVMIKLVPHWENNKCTLTRHFAQFCKTKASSINAELASQQQLKAKIHEYAIIFRQMRMIAMRKTLKSSQIYSVATINKIGIKHIYIYKFALRRPTHFFGNFFICGPIRTKFAQYM